MKKPSLFLYLMFFATVRLNAADDEGSDFIKMARAISPAHYNLYLAAKIGDEEFLAVYEPTDEEPRVKEEKKKIDAYSAWLIRQYTHNSQLDPSDPKPEKGKSYYDLFKAKVGPKNKLEEVDIQLDRYRGSGEEIWFLDKVLCLPGPGGNRPMFLPVNPKDGPTLLRSKLEKSALNEPEEEALMNLDYDALYEKLALTMFDLGKKN